MSIKCFCALVSTLTLVSILNFSVLFSNALSNVGSVYLLRSQFLVSSPERSSRAVQVATTYLEQALRWYAPNPQAQLQLGRAYLLSNKYDLAEEALRNAIELVPTNVFSRLLLGDTYDAWGYPGKAVTSYEKIGYNNRKEQALANYLMLISRAFADHNTQRAEEMMQKALALYPRNLSALFYSVELTEGIEEGKARPTLEDLKYFAPESIRPYKDSRLNLVLADTMRQLLTEGVWSNEVLSRVLAYLVRFYMQEDGTLEILDSVAEWSRPDGLFYLGELYERRGELDMAEHSYRQVITLDPQYADAYLRLALIAYERADSNPKIAPCGSSAYWFQRYLSLRPYDVFALTKLAELQDNGCQMTALEEGFHIQRNDREVVADLLDVPVSDVQLGDNLLQLGDVADSEVEKARALPMVWVAWFGSYRGINDAVFAGKEDGLISVTGHGALMTTGLWRKEDRTLEAARAGYWYRTGLTLVPHTPYLLSFFYRTERLEGGDVVVNISGGISSTLGVEYLIPETHGAWRKVTLIFSNTEEDPVIIKPILRSYGLGTVWFDGLELRQIHLNSDIPIGSQPLFDVE